jgi:hypothetical protein
MVQGTGAVLSFSKKPKGMMSGSSFFPLIIEMSLLAAALPRSSLGWSSEVILTEEMSE